MCGRQGVPINVNGAFHTTSKQHGLNIIVLPSLVLKASSYISMLKTKQLRNEIYKNANIKCYENVCLQKNLFPHGRLTQPGRSIQLLYYLLNH